MGTRLFNHEHGYAYDAFNGAYGDFTALRQNGAVMALRYICGDRAGKPKELYADEVAALHAADIGVVAVWEWTANEAMGGYGLGRQYAIEAYNQLTELGYPLGDVPVFWCADSGQSNLSANRAQVLQYARGWRDVFASAGLTEHALGVYGGQQLIEAVADAQLAYFGWRAGAASWSSYAEVSSAIHILQLVGSPVVGGITIDVNTLTGFVPGWVAGNDTPIEEEEKVITVVREDGYAASFASDGMLLRWLPDQAAYDKWTKGQGDAGVVIVPPGTLAAWGALVGPVPPEGTFGTHLDKLRSPAGTGIAPLRGAAHVNIELS